MVQPDRQSVPANDPSDCLAGGQEEQNSFGFRPSRGSKDALREVDRLLKAGYTHVVDADLKAYFDSIPHEQLMQEVRRYIADGRLLELIERFLGQDIME